MGRIVATPGALAAMEEAGVDPASLLARHQSSDYGDIPAEDRRENAYAIKYGFRVMSSYPLERTGFGQKVWIITEADRSSTCILLPSEY